MHDRNRTFRTLLATLAVWIIVAMSATLAGCTTAAPTGTPGPAATVTPDVQSSATVDRFRTGEVQNYKGQNLDPAIGPSDNSISGIQHVDISVYRLVIDGSVGTPASLTYDEVLALAPYERKITLHCVTGWSATILWKGVLLDELIQKAGPKASAVTVVFSAEDGYTTSLPLALIREKGLILAYQANGLTLPDATGYPFIVVAEDKFGYKWARWVTHITLSDDPDYQGYWESRGYDNTADVAK